MKAVLFLVFVALVMAGCSLDNPVGREAESPQITTNPDDAACVLKPRPLALVAKYDETWETIKNPDFANNDPYAIIEIKGVGFCTHLGLSTIYIHEYLNVGVKPTEMYGDYTSLTSIETGEKLEGWVEGFGYSTGENTNKFEGTWHITGGTGQYKDATGEAEFYGEGEKNPDGSGQGWVKFKGYFLPGAPII
jgi:hypothetical protein